MKPAESDKPLRLFIAIHVPGDLLQGIEHLQRQLQQDLPQGLVRWSPARQIHLTLRFLGNISPAEVVGLQAALGEATRSIPPFELALRELGCFPSWRKPRVLWLGVTGQVQILQRLHACVERHTAAWGEREERPFHPHLTLGRVRNLSPGDASVLKSRLEGAAGRPLGSWEVTRVHLMQSWLLPQGARHEPLSGATLDVALPP